MKIIYVDPQSYNNLADYDKYLLENIPIQKYFVCSHNMPFNSIDNTTIIYNYYYYKYKGFRKLCSYLFSQLKLLRIIIMIKPDIIHYQWLKIPVFDYFLLMIVRRILGCKQVFTAHNVLPHDSGSKYERTYKKIYNIVNQIIIHSEITKSEVIEKFEIESTKLYVVPHGLLPITTNSYQKKDNDIIVFSFIGYLSEYKGLDILVDAWLSNENIYNNKKCKLIIAGSGNLACLKRIPLNKNVVVYNDFLPDEELDRIIINSDVGILPYKKISQSGVLLTLIAQKIPVIVSNIGGLVQPFTIGQVGWILKNLNSDELAKLINELIMNPSLITTIKENNKLWDEVHNFYSWKQIGRKTLMLYSIV